MRELHLEADRPRRPDHRVETMTCRRWSHWAMSGERRCLGYPRAPRRTHRKAVDEHERVAASRVVAGLAVAGTEAEDGGCHSPLSESTP